MFFRVSHCEKRYHIDRIIHFLQFKKFLVANEAQDIISAYLILLRCESDRKKSENYTTAKIAGYTV